MCCFEYDCKCTVVRRMSYDGVSRYVTGGTGATTKGGGGSAREVRGARRARPLRPDETTWKSVYLLIRYNP